MMLNHLSERLRLPRRHACRSSAAQERAGATRRAPGAQHLAEFRLEAGPAGLALRGRRHRRSRSACSCRTGRTPSTSTYRLVAGRRARSGSSCGPSVHFRPHEAPVDAPLERAATRSPPSRTATSSRADARPPAAAAQGRTARERGLHARRAHARTTCSTASRRAAATTTSASCGARATSASTLAPDSATHADRLDRGLGDDRRALAGARRSRAERERRDAAPARRGRPARATGLGGGAGAGRRPVHHHARRPRRGRRPRARRRRRGAHRHRRLPLVHRLGPRHDDQPRGADARHRPPRRGRLHPAHLRPLRPRRPDPEHVPRGRERGPLPHGRRDAVVLPRARPLPRGDRRPRRRCGCCCRRSLDIVEHHLRGHALRHRRRSGGRPARARARRAISSPGWTPRSTTGW